MSTKQWMYTKQWMLTHRWMLEYTHQTEWIERRGILVWIAEVFTTLGSGLYLVSLIFDSFAAMVAAWIIIMFLKVPIHLAYFGKPLRFWRTLPPFTKAWKTSWFTRGIVFTILFGTFAFIQIVITAVSRYAHLLPSNSEPEIAFKAISAITAVVVAIYGGLIMNFCKSVPFWKSNLLPVVFFLAGIADGFGLMVAISLSGGDADLALAEVGTRWTVIASLVILLAYLVNAGFKSPAARLAVTDLTRGHSVIAFWLGVVALGIVVPLIISIAGPTAGAAYPSLLILAVVAHTAGAFALKYCLLKEGIHRPILPVKPAMQAH